MSQMHVGLWDVCAFIVDRLQKDSILGLNL